MDQQFTRQSDKIVVRSNTLATYTYQGIPIQLSCSGLIRLEVDHFVVSMFLDGAITSQIVVQDTNFHDDDAYGFTIYETPLDINAALIRESSSLLKERANVAAFGLSIREYVQAVRDAQLS